jgi:hypothetical protein
VPIHRPETNASAGRVIHLIGGRVQKVSALEYRQMRETWEPGRATAT